MGSPTSSTSIGPETSKFVIKIKFLFHVCRIFNIESLYDNFLSSAVSILFSTIYVDREVVQLTATEHWSIKEQLRFQLYNFFSNFSDVF
jgi:hypothetical protein